MATEVDKGFFRYEVTRTGVGSVMLYVSPLWPYQQLVLHTMPCNDGHLLLLQKEILGWRDLLKCILQASGKTLQKLPSTTAASVGASVEAEHQGATCGVLGQPVYEL